MAEAILAGKTVVEEERQGKRVLFPAIAPRAGASSLYLLRSRFEQGCADSAALTLPILSLHAQQIMVSFTTTTTACSTSDVPSGLHLKVSKSWFNSSAWSGVRDSRCHRIVPPTAGRTN